MPKMIRNEVEHEEALDRINDIFQAEPGTPEGIELDELVYLVREYETEHYDIEPPDPEEAIKFRMDQERVEL